jgi:hypothetical protein
LRAKAPANIAIATAKATPNMMPSASNVFSASLDADSVIAKNTHRNAGGGKTESRNQRGKPRDVAHWR